MLLTLLWLYSISNFVYNATALEQVGKRTHPELSSQITEAFGILFKRPVEVNAAVYTPLHNLTQMKQVSQMKCR